MQRRRGGGKANLALARKSLGVIYHTLKNNWVFGRLPQLRPGLLKQATTEKLSRQLFMGLGMTSKNLLNRESGSAFKERRSFIGAMATLGAGLAGSVILPATGLAQPTPEAHKKTKSAASVCGHRTVI